MDGVDLVFGAVRSDDVVERTPSVLVLVVLHRVAVGAVFGDVGGSMQSEAVSICIGPPIVSRPDHHQNTALDLVHYGRRVRIDLALHRQISDRTMPRGHREWT